MGNEVPKMLYEKKEVADAATGLTANDISKIQFVWKLVHRPEVGEELFYRLFKAHPETKSYFKFSKDKTDEEIKNSPQLKAQVVLFMNGLNNLVSHLRKPDVAVALANRIGEVEKKLNIPKKYFSSMKAILGNYLKKDAKVSDDLLGAWDKFMKFLDAHLISVHYKESK